MVQHATADGEVGSSQRVQVGQRAFAALDATIDLDHQRDLDGTGGAELPVTVVLVALAVRRQQADTYDA